MLARALTFTIAGVDPRPLHVEVDVRPGLPSTTFIGYADQLARETRESVRCALLNSGFVYPDRRVSVNVAPASLRRPAPAVRLAAAVGILAATQQLDPRLLKDTALYGQVSLGGEVMSLPGSLAVAHACARNGIRRLLVAAQDASSAARIGGVEVVPMRDVGDITHALSASRTATAPAATHPVDGANSADVADLRVPAHVLLALEIAAAGGHHLLLDGPAGSGHTMLARRLPSVMAPLTAGEALQTAELHGIVGLPRDVDERRPFRAPHHTISPAGLVGGGSPLRPGEATLAHLGILYLQDLESFQRATLEALTLPLKERRVVLVRGERALELPASFTLVASAGGAEQDRDRVQRRLAPVAPYFDLRVPMRPPTPSEQAGPSLTDSATVRARVSAARDLQTQRGQTIPNADLSFEEIAQRCTPRAAAILQLAYDVGAVSCRGRAQLARVAQTVSDLYFGWADHRVDEHAIRAAVPLTAAAQHVGWPALTR